MGAWRGAWRGAWSNELGARERMEPERDPSKHLTFCSLVYFVCLFVELLCSAAPQDTLHFTAQLHKIRCAL